MARETEKREVERMRSMEVIEPASGEWASVHSSAAEAQMRLR